MAYRHAIGNTAYVFNDLRDLLAKASPPRSGDRLAGVAAEGAEQMVAARLHFEGHLFLALEVALEALFAIIEISHRQSPNSTCSEP